MDKISNPFSPGAGSPPPALVGRDEIMEQARVLLGRIRAKRPEKSLLLTGLRGVGKTVLLNHMERMAQAEEYHTILLEAHDGKPLGELLAPSLRQVMFELARQAGAGNKARRGLAVLKSFIGAIRIRVGELEIGLDIEPEQGSADSGDLEVDLPVLFCAVAEAAEENGAAVAILIDEIQYLSSAELSALIMAMHKMQQRQLPMVLIGAGLPILPGLAGDSKSYAERLFNFPDVGPLHDADAAMAIQGPVEEAGEQIKPAALKEIVRLTQGYPYFLQEWGYQVWNHAKQSPITPQDVRQTSEVVSKRLDQNFFRVRFDRLTPKEKQYLRAMAELGPGPHRSGDIAEKLGRSLSHLGQVRAGLVKKGMVYSPAYGEIAFTVPLFDAFLRRVVPDFEVKP